MQVFDLPRTMKERVNFLTFNEQLTMENSALENSPMDKHMSVPEKPYIFFF